MDKDALKSLAEENLSEAIEKLESALPPASPQLTEVVHLKFRLTALERDNRLGLLGREQYSVEKNKATLAFLHLLDTHDAPMAYGASFGRRHPILWQQMQSFYIQHFDVDVSQMPHSDLLDQWKVWLPYQDQLWAGTLENGCFVLRNEQEINAVKYHFIQLDKLPMEKVPVSVEVKSTPATGAGPIGGAGLLFSFDEISRYYFAFIISGNQYSYFERNENGFRHLASARTHLIKVGEFNKLAIVQDAPFYHLYINDQYAKAVRFEKYSSGHSGVIAFGTGEFAFDNLTFYK